ncbi:MAG: succinylglutamate desuccinylase/aspartoacylase family protein [Alcaligenaceae bacterium]
MSLPSKALLSLPENIPLQDERPFQALRFTSPIAGPRLIITAAVHGNETCGTFAIKRLIQQIEEGEIKLLCGTLTVVPVTNPKAYRLQRRAGDRNLNRRLAPTKNPEQYEDHLANWLCPLLAEHDGLLDLHSFQSGDRAFALFGPANNAKALEPFTQAETEEALVQRLGCNRFVYGWLDTYAKGIARRIQEVNAGRFNASHVDIDTGYGVGTTEYMRANGGWAITLECGQHDDVNGREVAYQAIINTLVHTGLIKGNPPAAATNFEVLGLYDVFDRFDINDQFSQPWKSFDSLKKGTLIGTRTDGTALNAEQDCFIVFPNIKSQPGQEWFYLARAGGRLGR